MASQNFYDPADEDYSNLFKPLKIIRTAMIAGCLLFLGIIILLIEVLKKQTVALKDMSNILLIVCTSIAVISFVVRQMFFKKRMQSVNEESNFKNKTEQFRLAVIISFALIEFPALLSIICYFLSGNQLLIALTLVMVAQFATIRLNPDVISS